MAGQGVSRGTVAASGSATATVNRGGDRKPRPPWKPKSAQHPQRDVPLRLVEVLSSKNWSSPVVVGPVVAVGKARSGFPQPRQIP